MILNDQQITRLVWNQAMISPFEPKQVRQQGLASLGLGSFGYDARAVPEFQIFTSIDLRNSANASAEDHYIDPGDFQNHGKQFLVHRVNTDEDPFYLGPGGYALSATLEYFKMPRDVMGLVVGKSTLARCGIFINVTPIEPGWEGQITLEISNLNRVPVILRPNQGLCQILFFQGEFPPLNTYDSSRKYQNQVGIVHPQGG